MTEHIVASPVENREGVSTENDAHETVDDREIKPLYPQVQQVMDDLRRLIDKNQENGIRYTERGEPIITGEVLEAWAKEEGFGNGKRGTFHNGETYVYIKGCNLVEKENDVDKTLETARHMTELGAIHPESQWGVFRSNNGYQLFVVSPKLEAWSLEEKLKGTYDDRTMQPDPNKTYLLDWFQRIDPHFVPGQPIPENSLLHHLNWTEASHHNNWGWDETGMLFPLDVEVLNPTEHTYKNYEPWRPTYDRPEAYYLDI